jgi:hypothetical protein
MTEPTIADRKPARNTFMPFSKITRHFSKFLLGSTVILFGTVVLLPAIATAPMPPKLVLAKLNGKLIHVLYVTRSSDRVLVRCYPGEQPRVAVREKADGTKEGTLTCGN